MSEPPADLWPTLFGRSCRRRLRRRTAAAWGHRRWGRCELRRDHPGHCALDYGLWVLMFGGDPFRVHLEPTEMLARLVADRLHGEGRW